MEQSNKSVDLYESEFAHIESRNASVAFQLQSMVQKANMEAKIDEVKALESEIAADAQHIL